jgi:hypothetical protein
VRPNLAEYCGYLPANLHLRHGRLGIEQCQGDPIVMQVAMAFGSHSLERRHPHRAEAVTVRPGDDPHTMPSVTQSHDYHL